MKVSAVSIHGGLWSTLMEDIAQSAQKSALYMMQLWQLRAARRGTERSAYGAGAGILPEELLIADMQDWAVGVALSSSNRKTYLIPFCQTRRSSGHVQAGGKI